MPPDFPPPAPASPPPVPPPRPPREPVPGWMWLLFSVGPIALGLVLGLISALPNPKDLVPNTLGGALCGLVFAVPLAGGLGLSGRFFTTQAGRIGGGILFAGLLMVGLGAVLFAGCMCILQQGNMH